MENHHHRQVKHHPEGHEHRGRNRGGAYGPGGDCVCVKCGAKIPHRKGEKCTKEKCPKCGHPMVREEMVN